MADFLSTAFNQINPLPGGHLFSNLGQQTMIALAGVIVGGGLLAAGPAILNGLASAWAGVEFLASPIIEHAPSLLP